MTNYGTRSTHGGRDGSLFPAARLDRIKRQVMSDVEAQMVVDDIELLLREREQLRAAAGAVTALYPTVAGTAILIRDANRHVPRNAWDNVSDEVWKLSECLRKTEREV